MLWIILTAFKSHTDALSTPPKFIFTPTLDNFVSVFARAYERGGAAVDTHFDLFFFNSIFIAGASVGVALIIGTIAAYGFSRWPLRGNETYLFIILTTRMLPPIIVIIPIFIMFRLSGLSGSYHRDHSALRGVQPAVHHLDDEELLRRDTAGGGRRGAHGRQLGDEDLLPHLPAAGEGGASRRPPSSA